MFKKILVPLDGSEYGECILGLVKDIAIAAGDPQVVLLGVAEPILYVSEMGEDWLRDSEKKAESAIAEYLSRVATDMKGKGIAVETTIVRGKAAGEILKYARDNQVDLVMMSTHGRTGASYWFIGSVTERVVRHSVAPVLVASPSACRWYPPTPGGQHP